MNTKLFVVFLSLFMAIGSGPAFAAGFISDKWDFENDGTTIILEGATDDAYETTFEITDPASSDKVITVPNSTGYMALDTTGATAGNILLETEIDASSELLALMDDETGTGLLVFGTTPTLTTPVIGAATGTSLAVTGNITSSNATTLGWSVVAGANTACNTTCTSACVMGVDTADGDFLLCTDATADFCLCAGAS